MKLWVSHAYLDTGWGLFTARSLSARKGTIPLTSKAMSEAKTTRPGPVPVRPDATATLTLILAQLEDAKAEDTTTIDLTGKSTIGDHMVVTCGRSNRQVAAIADRLLEALSNADVKGVRVEGMPHCDWVLLDAGDVIVHIFRPEVRAFYNLEKMWSASLTPERRAS